MIVGIGPGIKSCHFEIKHDIVDNFGQYPKEIIKKEGRIFVDLPEIIKKQILSQGIPTCQIEDVGECTYCLKGKYFSYRRDGVQKNRMTAYLALK